MYKSNVIPYIFTKKIQTNYKLVPFNIYENSVGKTKYLPPVAKEWKNTVYNYNSNNTINYPVYDLKINSLIQSYFNLYFNHKFLEHKYISRKKKRKSLNKIFVSKAEIKHTNSKAIITIYIYNREKLVLLKKIRKFRYILSKVLFRFKVLKNYLKPKYKIIEKPFFNKIGFEKTKYFVLDKTNVFFILKLLLSKINDKILSYPWIINNNNVMQSSSLLWKIANLKVKYEFRKIDHRVWYKSKRHVKWIYRLLILIRKYRFRLSLNKYKFQENYLYKLSKLIEKYYGKKVEFNIVNVKSVAYNVDIFNEILTTKLKKAKSSPVIRINTLLSKIFLPKVNTIIERGRVEKTVDFNLVENKYKNLNISSIIKNDLFMATANTGSLNSSGAKAPANIRQSSLDRLFYNLHDSQATNTTFMWSEDNSYEARSRSRASYLKIKDIIFENINYKVLGGARLRVKGRLTRRYRADRAVYKLKWKGGLKNIDSAFRGLSSVVFRGYLDSNVEKSKLVSKRRIGSFGVISAISGK